MRDWLKRKLCGWVGHAPIKTRMRDGRGGYRDACHCNNCGIEMSRMALWGRNFIDDEIRDTIFKNGIGDLPPLEPDAVKSIILGPDGRFLDRPESTPKRLLEFFAYETIGIVDPDIGYRSGSVMDNMSASEAEDCGFESRPEHHDAEAKRPGTGLQNRN